METLKKLELATKNKGITVGYSTLKTDKNDIIMDFLLKNSGFCISFQEKNYLNNLSAFSNKCLEYFSDNNDISFNSFQAILYYLSTKLKKIRKKFYIILDEYQLLTKNNNTIDDELVNFILNNKNSKIYFIITTSQISYLNSLKNFKSKFSSLPISYVELNNVDFNYFKNYFINYSINDLFIVKSLLGNHKRYIKQFNPNFDILTNIKENILDEDCLLHNENNLILKNEFRELNKYNSILLAIANGYSKLADICLYTNMNTSECSSYLSNLQSMSLIQRNIPYDDNENSKKSFYSINNNLLNFYYRYIFNFNHNSLNDINLNDFLNNIYADFKNNLRKNFSKDAIDYLFRESKKKSTPFEILSAGSWWGLNPITNEQDYIDIVSINKNYGLFGLCKFSDEVIKLTDLENLIISSHMFHKTNQKYYYLFSNKGFSKSLIQKSKDNKYIKLIKLKQVL